MTTILEMILIFSYLLTLTPLTLGATYSNWENLPKIAYDFIIVGGSTLYSFVELRPTDMHE